MAAAGKQRDDVTQKYWNTVSTQQAAVTSHATGLGEYRVTCFLGVRQLHNKASCVVRWYDYRVYKRNENVYAFSL
jgi:hypothetical protein